MTVDLDVPDDQLPDAVATTAYYVASEALTNAVKHAEARRLDVRVVRSNGVVRVRISDDGRGGTTLRAGSGLAGLNDRVAALGGSLTVASPAGRGTVVEAVLPCGS
jgi:signal transduction histidine kinase